MGPNIGAFTLLEVLIVVSIFALISSFVYPSVSKIVTSFQVNLESKKAKTLEEFDDFCVFLGGRKGCFVEKR